MRSIVNLGTKLSLAALTALVTMSCAMANTLSEVQISAEDSGYAIVLKTDETAQMKKIISSDNKMTLELKDVEVSSDLNTVYNNAADIENVTISPAAKSGVKIVFKGEGIANSKVSFENAKTVAASLNTNTQNQSIQLSGPVSSYTPVYNPDAFASEEEDQTSNPQLNEVLTKMHVTKQMLITAKRYTKNLVNKAKSGDINMMTVMGVIFIIAALMMRPKKKETSTKQQQSLTGLLSRNQQSQRSPQIEREIGLNRQMTGNMSLNRNTGLVNSGYGMKAYQQSQKNPYTTNTTGGVSGIARRKPLSSSSAGTPIKKQTLSNKPVMPSKASMSMPVKSKMPSMINPTVSKKTAVKEMEPSNLDSMKFLESITKIYEKNGRADLAKGLKDNLKKAQLSNHAVL